MKSERYKPTRAELDANRLASIAATPLDEARQWLQWLELLAMERDDDSARATELARIVRAKVELGEALTEHDMRQLSQLRALAAGAQASRRAYEADRLAVELRREDNPARRGRNGRRRAACQNKDTGREQAPPAFTGGARFLVARARAAGRKGVCHYTVVTDPELGLYLYTAPAATSGRYSAYDTPEIDPDDYGALVAIRDAFCAKGPADPETAATAREARAERNREQWQALAREAWALPSKRRGRRGRRGRGRGKGSNKERASNKA